MFDKTTFQESFEDPFAKNYFSFLKTAISTEKMVKSALKPFGLTHAQLNVLYILTAQHPEPMHMKSIKKQMILPNPDLTRLIDRLERKELVERSLCKENRRQVEVLVSPKGLQYFYKAHLATKEKLHNFFSDKLSLAESTMLGEITKKMI